MKRLFLLLSLTLLTATGILADDAVREELNVKYGEANGQPLLLDVFRPVEQKEKRPAIIFVHGGGWAAGDKKDFAEGARGMVKNGYVAFCIGYRLVKTNDVHSRWPAQIDDVQRAVRWIRSQADVYQLDPDRIGAVGASAGGHLVSLLGLIETRDNSDKALSKYSSKVQCVINIFGPSDLTPDFTTNGPAGPYVQGLVDNLMGKPKNSHLALFKEASPLFQVTTNAAPFIHFHGTMDPLVPLDQSQRLDAALKKAGIESTLVVFQGEGHGFKNPDNVQTFVIDSLMFLNKHLRDTGKE